MLRLGIRNFCLANRIEIKNKRLILNKISLLLYIVFYILSINIIHMLFTYYLTTVFKKVIYK